MEEKRACSSNTIDLSKRAELRQRLLLLHKEKPAPHVILEDKDQQAEKGQLEYTWDQTHRIFPSSVASSAGGAVRNVNPSSVASATAFFIATRNARARTGGKITKSYTKKERKKVAAVARDKRKVVMLFHEQPTTKPDFDRAVGTALHLILHEGFHVNQIYAMTHKEFAKTKIPTSSLFDDCCSAKVPPDRLALFLELGSLKNPHNPHSLWEMSIWYLSKAMFINLWLHRGPEKQLTLKQVKHFEALPWLATTGLDLNVYFDPFGFEFLSQEEASEALRILTEKKFDFEAYGHKRPAFRSVLGFLKTKAAETIKSP